jgi:predicted amidohydrolase YtcJ
MGRPVRRSGLVWTHDDGSVEVDVLIENGRIVHLGPLSAAQLDDAAEIIDLNPLLGLTTAVTRQTAAAQPASGWIPEERLDLSQALAAYTRGSAYQAFLDDTGAIQVGNRADPCWIMADLREAELSRLPHAQVLGTWVNGQRTRWGGLTSKLRPFPGIHGWA